MRLKYIARCDTVAFGIRYDRKKRMCTLGGPFRYLPHMSFLIKPISVWPACPRDKRVSHTFRCTVAQLQNILANCRKSGYTLQTVRCFRRLMN